VPTAPVSVTVALADKIDTLTGFWAIDEKPTGSKDPFALRRAALGVIRLVLENDLTLALDPIIDSQLLRHMIHINREADAAEIKALRGLLEEIANHGVFGAAYRALVGRLQGQDAPDLSEGSLLATVGNGVPDREADLLAFIHDRLKVFLRDQGIRHDVIDACIAMPGNDDLTLLVKRARALSDVLGTEDGENLLQGFKRANNILTQAEDKDGVEYSYGAEAKFAETASETALFAALDTARGAIAPALSQGDFPAAMAAMAALRGPIDAFFEDVQVNTDNAVLRRNRLNLLHDIRQICTSVADLTRIEA
jgi:glycyl-tRNA synthetase beta chain